MPKTKTTKTVTAIDQPADITAQLYGPATDEQLHPDSSTKEEYDPMSAPDGEAWRLELVCAAQSYLDELSYDDLTKLSQTYHSDYVQMCYRLATLNEEQPCEHMEYRRVLLSNICADFAIEIETRDNMCEFLRPDRIDQDGPCDDPECDCNN